jgi:PAS domain S-box-containing protein
MSQPKNFLPLFVSMTVPILLINAISMVSLYRAELQQHKIRLVDSVNSQARLIEEMARYVKLTQQSQNLHESTLERMAKARKAFKGFGESWELVLGRIAGNRIHFDLSINNREIGIPHSIPLRGEWAEAMRPALHGESGTAITFDYNGTEVLAAYLPIALLKYGLVAKIDMHEIRAPYIQTGLIALATTLLLIFLAGHVFFRLTRPIQKAIDQQAEIFRTLAETAREGIFLAQIDGTIQYVNPSAESLFGYNQNELLGKKVNCLMPENHKVNHDDYIRLYMETGVARIIGIGRQLSGIRKDGSRFPLYLSVGDIKQGSARLFAGVVMDTSENHQLQREILETSTAEQRRIGQELHDGLGQQLTGLGMLATSLLNKVDKPEHQLASQLAEGLKETIVQVRALSRGLIPVDIDSAGIAPAIENLVSDVQIKSGIPIHFTITETIYLSDNNAALHLYRIVQEALNNALKHAGASRVGVSLSVKNGLGSMTIEDDGKGFPDNYEQKNGLGLSIMRHRCSLFDGEVFIEEKSDVVFQLILTTMANISTILIVDDHPLVRTGFAQLIGDCIDLEVSGEASDIKSALHQIDQNSPDLAIIDLSLAEGSGLDLIERVKARSPDILMLVASIHDELLYAERLLTAGAKGYINKQEAQDKIILAIRQVLSGKVYLSEKMTERLLSGIASGRTQKRDVETLTNRELQVFELIGHGASTSQMAEQLKLSVKTIESHQANIKRKLDLETGHALIHRAIRWVVEQEE